jgi:maspardin
MNRRAALLAGAMTALAVAAVYGLPRTRSDLSALYAEVDPTAVASLRAFRAAHPVRRLTVEGWAWEYVTLGEGPDTVLFLHGLSGAHDIWWQQLEALAPTHRVLAVTYPAVRTLAELSVGVRAVLDAHGIQTATIVGSSLGGYLAQYLVQHHRDRVERAVFANTFPPNDRLRAAHHHRAVIGRFLPERAVAAAFRDSNTRRILPASRDPALVGAYLSEQAQQPGLKRRLLARYHTVIEPFAVADPTPAGLPLLVLESSNDPLIDAELRAELRATYPTAEVHTFADGGHFPYLDQPAAYTAVLRRFLA